MPDLDKLVGRSTIYGHGKTQVPHPIRTFLEVEDGDVLFYVQTLNGEIAIRKGNKLIKSPKTSKNGKYT